MSLTLGVDPRTREGKLQEPDARAYVTTAAVRVEDHREATRLMLAGHDFHSVALVEEAVTLPTVPTSAAASVRFVSFGPERLELTVTSDAPGLLVIGEAYYPGWTATVDDVPARCIPANAWMRAVPVPAGSSRVVLRFRSRMLLAGALVSCATVLLLLLYRLLTRP